MRGISWVAENLLVFQEGVCSMEWAGCLSYRSMQVDNKIGPVKPAYNEKTMDKFFHLQEFSV